MGVVKMKLGKLGKNKEEVENKFDYGTSFLAISIRLLFGIGIGFCNFQGMNPLAISYFVGIKSRILEKIILLVCMTGSIFIRLGVESALRYGLIMGVFFILYQLGLAFFEEHIVKKAVLGGLITVGMTSVSWLFSMNVMKVVKQGLLEGVLVVMMTILLHILLEYQQHRQRKMEQEEFVAFLIWIGLALYGMPSWTFSVLGISCYVSQVVACLLLLMFAYRYGLTEGAVMGMVLGSVLYLKNESLSFGTASIFYSAGFYAVGGIFAGLGRKLNRICSIFAMLIISSFLFRWAQDLRGENWYTLLAGSILFLFVPRVLVQKTKENQEKNFMEEMLFLQMKTQLKEVSEAFKKLKNTLLFSKEEWKNEQEKEQVLERTIQKVCQNCEMATKCWQENQIASYQEVSAVLESVELSQATEEWQENAFFIQCSNPKEFFGELQHGMEMNRLDTLCSERILEGKQAMASQFEQISYMIDDLFVGNYKIIPLSDQKKSRLEEALSKEKIRLFEVVQFKNPKGKKEIYITATSIGGRVITVRELSKMIGKIVGYSVCSKNGNRLIVGKKLSGYGFVEESKFYFLQGVAKANKQEVDISGDNFSILECQQGKLGVMIADGMGSGTYASQKSCILVELMEHLLEAGFLQDASLRLANAVLVTPLFESNFSTLDFCMIDLYKGKYEFYKIGGATSFLKRGKTVKKIEGGSIPMGIFTVLEYDFYEDEVQDGDLLFLLSDGVMEAVPYLDKEEFVKNEIQKLMLVSPQEMAVRLLTRMQEFDIQNTRDDMTIVVVGLWKRSSDMK